MKSFFEEIQLDTNEFNSQFYLFILYLSEVYANSSNPYKILNYYREHFTPNKSICFNEPPFKKENNKIYIDNEFEKILINPNDYVIKNILSDYNNIIPLEILLQRNISFDYFNKYGKQLNFLNDNELYKEFKEYFKLFINSKLVKEVLNKFDPNLKNIIESKIFKGNELDEEYVKTIPLIFTNIQAFTNKDLGISFISSSPFIVQNLKTMETIDEYNNIKFIHVILNIGGKFIIVLHEIIHLNYAFLHYLSEGKLKCDSPRLKYTKKSKKDENNDDNSPKKTEVVILSNYYLEIKLKN